MPPIGKKGPKSMQDLFSLKGKEIPPPTPAPPKKGKGKKVVPPAAPVEVKPEPEPVVFTNPKPLGGEWREKYEKGLIADGAVIVAPSAEPREVLPGQVRDIPVKVITPKPTDSSEEKSGESVAPKTPAKPRSELFGFAGTAVIRWMGSNGFDFDHAKKALEANGIILNDATLKIQLRAGKAGGDCMGRGEPANLTSMQADLLKKAAGLK